MSVEETIDWAAALRQFLESSSNVGAEVGTDVYVGKIPRGATMPGKVVVVLQAGGDPAMRLPLIRATFQARCYGSTSVEAREVYRAVRSDLHWARRQKIEPGVGIGSGDHWLVSAREVGGPSDMREPETEWYFVLAQFDVTFITFPVV